MKSLIATAAFFCLVAAAPAPDPETRADLRCFIAISALTGSEDAATQQAGMIGSRYFLGRIDGRSPGLDLENAIAAEAADMDEAQQKALLESCGAQLAKRGSEVVAAGERLEARGL